MFKKRKYSSHRPSPVKIVFMVLVFVAIASALSWLIMILWNSILTEVTSVKPLNFWKAAGLLLLTKILFSGIWKRSSRKHKARHKEWREKWINMSPRERREARDRWKEHCKHNRQHRLEEE